jgi:hypothetical protein
MDHREPPRIIGPDGRPRDTVIDDGAPPRPGRRFPRLAAPPAELGRLPRRAIWIGLGALGAFVLMGIAGRELWTRSLLALQPGYAMTFEQISLDPEPPAWYVGGKPAFLRRVAALANHPVEFNALEVDLRGISRAFALNPIVDRVSLVERKSRNRVVVHLAYHEPVAKTEKDGKMEFLLSRKAIFLPLAEVDLDRARPLSVLHGFARPDGPKEGLCWSKLAPEGDVAAPDLDVAESCRLAGFLHDHLLRDPEGPLSGHDIWIHPPSMRKKGETWLFFQVGSDQIYWWRRVPEDHARAPVEEKRWAQLRDWVKHHPPRKASETVDDLDFSDDGIVIRRTRSRPVSDRPNPPEVLREDRGP